MQTGPVNVVLKLCNAGARLLANEATDGDVRLAWAALAVLRLDGGHDLANGAETINEYTALLRDPVQARNAVADLLVWCVQRAHSPAFVMSH